MNEKFKITEINGNTDVESIANSFTFKMESASKDSSISTRDRLINANLNDDEILYYAKSNILATRQSMDWEGFTITNEQFKHYVQKEFDRVKSLINGK